MNTSDLLEQLLRAGQGGSASSGGLGGLLGGLLKGTSWVACWVAPRALVPLKGVPAG